MNQWINASTIQWSSCILPLHIGEKTCLGSYAGVIYIYIYMFFVYTHLSFYSYLTIGPAVYHSCRQMSWVLLLLTCHRSCLRAQSWSQCRMAVPWHHSRSFGNIECPGECGGSWGVLSMQNQSGFCFVLFFFGFLLLISIFCVRMHEIWMCHLAASNVSRPQTSGTHTFWYMACNACKV